MEANPSEYTIDFVIPQGPTGPTGATGETGISPTFEVGTVTTGAPGSSASVIITPKT